MKLLCCLLILLLLWSQHSAASGCPQLFRTNSHLGTEFMLNAHPNGGVSGDYENNWRCSYTLVTWSENRNGLVKIDFHNFKTESCCDYVEISYTNRQNSPTSFRLLGDDNPSRHYSLDTLPGTSVTALIHTDHSVTRPAFSMAGSTGH